MDNTSGTPVWHSPLQVPVTPYTSTISLPGAPQLGNDNTIDTSDTRLLNAVYRNGSLWTVHTVSGPATTKTEVAWYRIDPSAGTVLSQGRISDPTRWYYYPSIGVNQDNVAAVGFTGSSTDRIRRGVLHHRPVHLPERRTRLALLKAGEAPYYKTGQTMGIPGGATENRWGDFSATVVDPTDDVTFWTLQEYAQTPDPTTGVSRWGTWWGKFHPADVAPADRADRHGGQRNPGHPPLDRSWRRTKPGMSSNGRSGRRGRSESSPPLPCPRTVSRIRTPRGSLPVRRTSIGSARSVPPARRIPSKPRSRPRDRPRPPEAAAAGAADAFPHPIRRRGAVRHVARLRRNPPPARVRARVASFFPPARSEPSLIRHPLC